MGLLPTDFFLVNRGGQEFKMTADQIAVLVGAVNDVSAANIAGRDTLASNGDLVAGDRVFVASAIDDDTVDVGWAIYRYDGADFDKIQEQESLDIVISVARDERPPSPKNRQ